MKKPEEPFRSWNFIYCPETEDKTLLHKFYLHPDLDEKRFIEDYEDQHDGEKCPHIENWDYDVDAFSLQDILNQLPKEVETNNIFISIHRDRSIDHIKVKVVHRTPTDKKAWQAAHDAEEVEYQAKYKIYQEEMAAYEKWKTEQEIIKLQNKLEKLKNNLDT